MIGPALATPTPVSFCLKRVAHAAQRPLFGGDGFLLPFYAGFFVMFTLAQLSQDSRFFAEFFEATNSAFNGFVFSNSNSGHKLKSPPITPNPLLQWDSN